MADTTSAQDRFFTAFDTYLAEAGVADALSVATTVFVSLVIGYTEARGHDTNQTITINGGENRDITIHAPKKGRAMATDTAAQPPRQSRRRPAKRTGHDIQ